MIMEKDSKIYVAGHRGLVGSAITRRLEGEGYSGIVKRGHKELDLTRQNEVEAFFKKETPEYVFLSAAKVGGILANSTYKAEFIYSNIMIAANTIHAAYQSGVKKLLNLGSSCIYPKLSLQPMKEEYLLTGGLEPTNEPYAIAKISAIKLCRYYNEQYGTDFISVMPTNLFGPHDNFNLETAHVPPALIRKFHLAKLLRKRDFDMIVKDMRRFPVGFGLDQKVNHNSEESVEYALKQIGISGDHVMLWGSGEPYREFLFADDLADACIFLMNGYSCRDIGEFVNVGTGEDIRIKDLAELIKKVVGFDGEIRNDLSKPDGMGKKLLDISRIRALGWKPETGLKQGVKKTYAWYVSQYA